MVLVSVKHLEEAILRARKKLGEIKERSKSIKVPNGNFSSLFHGFEKLMIETQEVLERVNLRATRLQEANQALRESEARLSEAQRIAHLGNWELNIRDGQLFWSKEIHRIFGLDPETQQPSHQSFVQILHPEDRQRVVDVLYRALQNQQSADFDFCIRRPDGEERHLSAMSDVILDDQDLPLKMIGIFQDVTEQKAADERHRHTLELLEKVFTSIHLAIAHVDTNFNFIRVNQAYAREQDPRDFIGKNLFDLYPSQETRRIFRKVIETGEPQVVYGQPFRFKDQPERGLTFWNWSVQPVKEEDGRVSGLVQCLIEVTALRRAEEERNLLVTAVESSAEAIVVTDRNGNARYVNRAFETITGYSRSEVLGRDLHLLDSGAHDEPFFQSMRKDLESGNNWSGRLINRKKDGSLYHEECTIAPVRDSSGDITSYISIKRDVTEQLRLESIAGAVETMNNIGYIFSGIRHEIGNPVNALRVTLRLLKSRLDAGQPEKLSLYLDRAQEEVTKIIYLLNSLRSFNMFEDPKVEIVDTDHFLNQFASLILNDSRRRGILISTKACKRSTFCRADSRALQQVLLNVFTNACDALAEVTHPAIEIEVSTTERLVRFRIRDNGCGMSPSQLERIFQPFYTTKREGTGFGLVVTKKLLSQMNGHIEISSHTGNGTVVDIFLPRANLEESMRQAPIGREHPAAS